MENNSTNRKISSKSSSFGRLKIYMEGLNIDNHFIQNSTKSDVLKWVIRHGHDSREVFFAENLNIKTDDELRKIKKDIVKYIVKRLYEEGYEKNDIERIRGIIELHPTSRQEEFKKRYDPTMVNGHIHYWGGHSNIVKKFINEFIVRNRLSNRTKTLDYSASFMDTNVHYLKKEEGQFYSYEKEEMYIENVENAEIEIIENVPEEEFKKGVDFSEKQILVKEDVVSDNFFDKIEQQLEYMKNQNRLLAESLLIMKNTSLNDYIKIEKELIKEKKEIEKSKSKFSSDIDKIMKDLNLDLYKNELSNIKKHIQK
jgi:hypothetical protein